MAVRRWVVLYISKEYRCNKCNRNFIPDGFPIIRAKFGKGLISWCMYQMVVGRQNMSRIRIALRTLFGLHIDISTIYSFKETISFHYLNSYDEILKTLLSSPVLYADETVANLRSESGYVGVSRTAALYTISIKPLEKVHFYRKCSRIFEVFWCQIFLRLTT